MSWLGGLNDSFTQLSSLTGQLSGQITNFTKEVLTEGTEDNVDYEVETEKLKQQLKQYVLHLQEKEALVERLQQQNVFLQDKVNKAELDISTSGIEYEARLQQKSKEIALLKEKLSDTKGVDSGDTAVGALGHPILSSSFSAVTSDIGDDHFHEVIGYQQEIERLSHELEEARAQRDSWKEKANSVSSAEDVTSARRNADDALFDRVKELESALHRESKHHHQELKTIQDAHEATLRRYQDEVRKLKASVSEHGDSGKNASLGDRCESRDVNRMHGELETLREQLRTKNRQLQAQKKNLEEVQVALRAVQADLHNSITEKAFSQEEAQRLTREKQNLEKESETKQKILEDIYNGVQELMLVTGGTEKPVTDGNVLAIIAELKRASVRNSSVLSDVNNDASGAGDLAESDQWHNVELLDAAEEDQNAAPRRAGGADHGSSGVNEAGSQSQGDLTLTLEALQKQVEDYEREMEQYERAQSEWQVEKQSLQDLLNRYQSEVGGIDSQDHSDDPEDERTVALAQLRQELENLRGAKEGLEKETNRLVHEKEQLQVATKNLEEELNSSISEMQLERGQVDALKNDLKNYASENEKMQAAFESVSQELNRSRSEKDELFEALSTLDDQHQDEMAQLLLVRDGFKEKFKVAEEEISQIKNENDRLRKENESLRNESKEAMSQSKMADEMALTVNVLREKLKDALEQKGAAESTSAELHEELKGVKEKLDNTSAKLEAYKRKSEELDHVSVQSKISALEIEVSDLASQLEEKKAECVRLRDDNKELASSQAQSDTEKLCEELEEKLRKEQTTSEDLKRRFEDLSLLLGEREERLRTRESDVQRLEERLKETVQALEEKQSSQETVGLAVEQLQTSGSSGVAMSKISDLEEKVQKLTVLTSDTEAKLEHAHKEKLELEKECARKDEEIGSLCAELENSGKDVAQAQSAHEKEVRNLKAEHERFILEMKEKSNQLYSELQNSFATFKLEAEASSRVYIDKIAHLERANGNLQSSLDHAKEDASQESMDALENLRKQNSEFVAQLQSLSNDNAALKNAIETERAMLDSKLRHETEQKLQSQKEVATLESSLRKLQSETDALQEELITISSTLQDGSSPVTNDNDIRHTRNECDLRIESLLTETEELKKRLSVRKDIKIVDQRIDGLLAQIGRGDITDLEKADLSKEDIGSLLRLIKERGEVISLLAYRPMVEDKTAEATTAKQMQDANRTLTAEKDQILAVITEKTRENKKLKDETHKMMQVVSESQAALARVQQENASLRAKYEGYDREMTKEAVAKLSRLVMEKELEITALKQKCGTLLEVLQQQPNGETPNSPEIALTGKQVQGLLQDKETLSAQVQQLLAERNHLVALLNQSQSETERLRTEIVNAAKAMERDSDTNSKLQISFGNLVHEYEQTQMKLANVQKELIHFRKILSNLEVEKERLFTGTHNVVDSNATDAHQKSTDNRAEESSPGVRSDSSLLSTLQVEKEKKDVEIEKLTSDCREKDILIHSRTQEMARFKKEAQVKSNEVEILRKSVGNLREQVAELGKESEGRRKEILDCTSRLAEKEAESGAFQETNAQLSMLLKEKEYEIENAREKCRRLETMVEEDQQGKESETQKLLVELDQSKQCLIAARHERDQVMLSLKQRKLETDKYSEEASMLREKEAKLQSELARLRNHLVQVEEAYTQEAILAEDREKTLREQLERIRSSSSAAKEATEQSQQQAESLQEQLRTVIGQRDQAVQQVQLAQEKSAQYATALQKLQTAVERMQREEAATFTEQTNALKSKLEEKTNETASLDSQLSEMKVKLQDAKEALTSASRLNKQLELKEENIEQLKSLVAEKQLHIDELQDKIHVIVSKNEGMVDKEIVKNLVIGYFTTPANKRIDVLRLITSVLGFSHAECAKVESRSVQGGKKGWMGGWLGGWGGSQSRPAGSGPSSPTGVSPDQSFTQMFVKFLENESVPQQAARLPAAAMANESQQKINQRRFAASPALSSVPTPVGSSASGRTAPAIAGRFSPFMHVNPVTSTPTKASGAASARPALAMHPVTPILPTFTPLTDPNGAKQDTLQDILLNTGDR